MCFLQGTGSVVVVPVPCLEIALLYMFYIVSFTYK